MVQEGERVHAVMNCSASRTAAASAHAASLRRAGSCTNCSLAHVAREKKVTCADSQHVQPCVCNKTTLGNRVHITSCAKQHGANAIMHKKSYWLRRKHSRQALRIHCKRQAAHQWSHCCAAVGPYMI